jgi:hypothetical protein
VFNKRYSSWNLLQFHDVVVVWWKLKINKKTKSKSNTLESLKNFMMLFETFE